MRYYNCPLSSLARERLRELCSPLPIVVTLLPASLSPHWPTGRWLYKLYSLIYRTNLAPCKGIFVSHFVSDCTCTFSTSKGRKTHLHQTQCLFLLCRGCTVYMHVCNMHVHCTCSCISCIHRYMYSSMFYTASICQDGTWYTDSCSPEQV